MNQFFSVMNSLCRRLRNVMRKPVQDRQDPAAKDLENIEMSARLLRVSEFRFFQISYSRWYGRELSEKDAEAVFADYMMKDRVPHWARHFARQVMSRCAQAVHEPGDDDIECILPPVEGKGNGVFLPVFMVLMYMIFYLIFSGHITFQ